MAASESGLCIRHRRLRDVSRASTARRGSSAHPHSGSRRLICRIRSRSSVTDQGPDGSAPTFHARKRRNPCRASQTTVSAALQQRMSPAVHSFARKTQKIRSISVSRGRGSRAFHTALLPKRQVLERRSRCVRRQLLSVQRGFRPSDHEREIADQSAECKIIGAGRLSRRDNHAPEKSRAPKSIEIPKRSPVKQGQPSVLRANHARRQIL